MDKNLNLIDGELFKRLATKGAEALYKKKQEINDLNVFPVPDGDTGDNMCHTMEGGLSALAGDFGNHLGNMAKAFARGTLLKARGNSGVILSQLFRGLAEGLSDKAVATPTDWAKALRTGVEYGYKSVVNPVEGTILTVARMGAEGLTAVTDQTDLEGLFGGYLNALTDSLKNTPNQLKTLKEAGVVDSGGAGLTCIAEGFLMAVTKRDGDATAIDGFIKKPYQKEDAAVDDDEGFGFCTEVLLELSCPKFSLEDFKCELTKEGKSIVAVTMGDTLKVHVHTLDPLKVLGMCAALGELITVKVENMTRQHAALNIKNEDSLVPTQVGERLPVAVVAISQGPGFDQIYLENGATLENNGTISFNGQNQIPSTGDALDIYGTKQNSNITDFNNFGNGEVILGATGRFFGDTLRGNLNVSSSIVKGSFDNTYTISSALHASDISNLNLYSKSAMFETSTKKNENTGTDVVLTRKSFDNFTKNQSVAKFLDKNYQEKQNLSLYDDLKTAQSSKELSNKINNTTANDIIPTFRRQNALIQRSISKTFDDNLFNAPEQNYIAGYKYIDISNNPDNQIEESKAAAHTAYGLLKNKTSSNLTYGIGANITKLKSDYDNNSKRTANQLGLWLPLGYEFNNNLKWYSKLSALYSDASYDRHTNFGVKSADYNEYQINLDNSVRYTIDLNSTTSLTPLLELNYTKYLSDSINEGTSNNALKIKSSSADSLELGLGALLNKDFNFNQNQTLNIKIGGIYYVELLNPDKSLKANLNGNIGQFNIHSKQDKTRSVMTLKAKYDYNKALSIYGNIEKELNNDKSLLIDLGLQYNI